MKRYRLPLSELCQWGKLGAGARGIAGRAGRACTAR